MGPGDSLWAGKPGTPARNVLGSQAPGSARTLHEKTHRHGCCDRCYSRCGLGHGFGRGAQPELVIGIVMERDYVGIVPGDRSDPGSVVACSSTNSILYAVIALMVLFVRKFIRPFAK